MALSLERMTRTADALELGRVRYAAGQFFEAHAVWEEAWRLESGLPRRLLQGLIMAAGAYHKMAARQPRGMVLLLERALERLAPIPEGFEGLELERFRAGLASSLEEARAWLDGAPPPSGPAPLGARLRARPGGPGASSA